MNMHINARHAQSKNSVSALHRGEVERECIPDELFCSLLKHNHEDEDPKLLTLADDGPFPMQDVQELEMDCKRVSAITLANLQEPAQLYRQRVKVDVYMLT